MLTVYAANDGIQVRLGAASVAPLQIVGAYGAMGDDDSSIFRRRPFRAVTNGTTAIEILAGDGLSAKCVPFLSIKNPNVANAEVIIDYEIGGVLSEFMRVILAQHERLEYTQAGWNVYTNAGALKNSLNQGTNAVASGDSVVVLGGDITNNNATANTIASVTGLQFPVVAGTRYWFEFAIRYTAVAATTGSRWTILPPTFDELSYNSEYGLTATTKTFNSGLNAADLPAASNASTASIAAGGNIARIKGIIRPTANGDVVARFASEIASSAIVAKAGSFVRYRAL